VVLLVREAEDDGVGIISRPSLIDVVANNLRVALVKVESLRNRQRDLPGLDRDLLTWVWAARQERVMRRMAAAW
jgi:hypothetical protein